MIDLSYLDNYTFKRAKRTTTKWYTHSLSVLVDPEKWCRDLDGRLLRKKWLNVDPYVGSRRRISWVYKDYILSSTIIFNRNNKVLRVSPSTMRYLPLTEATNLVMDITKCTLVLIPPLPPAVYDLIDYVETDFEKYLVKKKSKGFS